MRAKFIQFVLVNGRRSSVSYIAWWDSFFALHAAPLFLLSKSKNGIINVWQFPCANKLRRINAILF